MNFKNPIPIFFILVWICSLDFSFADTPEVTPTATFQTMQSEGARRADELWEKGNQLSRKGFLKKANEYWEEALKLDPAISHRLNKSEPLSSDSDKQKRVDELVAHAEEACDKRDYSLALKYADTVDSLSPNEPRIETVRERVVLEDYQTDSDRPYDSMIKGLFDKAVDEYRAQNYSRALETVDKALEVYGDNQQLLKLEKLIETKTSATQAEKDMAHAESLWGDGDLEDASLAVEKILQADPDYQPALALKKKIEESGDREKTKEAETNLETASQKEKDGKYLEAKKYYEKALKMDPDIKEAANGLVRVRELVDPVEGKMVDLERALKAGNKTRAQELMAEIKELDPQNGALKKWEKKVSGMTVSEPALDSEAKADEVYNLGLQSYRNNDLVSAKKFWSDALELNPRHQQARRNLDRLLEEHPELKGTK